VRSERLSPARVTSIFWHYVVGMPWVWAVAASILLPLVVLGLIASDIHARSEWHE
jgi:hypothetical protein